MEKENKFMATFQTYWEMETKDLLGNIYYFNMLAKEFKDEIVRLEVANTEIKHKVEKQIAEDISLKNDKQRKAETLKLLEQTDYNKNEEKVQELKANVSEYDITSSIMKKIYYDRLSYRPNISIN